MGSKGSKGADLPTTTIDLDCSKYWAGIFGCDEWSDVSATLQLRDPARVGVSAGRTTSSTPAKFIASTRFAAIKLPAAEVTACVSFTRPARPINKAHVKEIQDKFFEGGFIGGETETQLTVSLELNPGGKTFRLVCINGYHRSHAFAGLQRARREDKIYPWKGSKWVDTKGRQKPPVLGEVSVNINVLWLGRDTDHSLFFYAAYGLNIPNAAAKPASFFDKVFAFKTMTENNVPEEEMKKSGLFMINENTYRLHRQVYRELTASPQAMGDLARYFGGCCDSREKGYFTTSKTRNALTNLRKHLGQKSALVFYVRWAVKHQTREASDVLKSAMGSNVKARYTAAMQLLVTTKADLERVVGPDSLKLHFGDDAPKARNVVDETLVSLLDSWDEIFDPQGEPVDNAKDVIVRKLVDSLTDGLGTTMSGVSHKRRVDAARTILGVHRTTVDSVAAGGETVDLAGSDDDAAGRSVNPTDTGKGGDAPIGDTNGGGVVTAEGGDDSASPGDTTSELTKRRLTAAAPSQSRLFVLPASQETTAPPSTTPPPPIILMNSAKVSQILTGLETLEKIGYPKTLNTLVWNVEAAREAAGAVPDFSDVMKVLASSDKLGDRSRVLLLESIQSTSTKSADVVDEAQRAMQEAIQTFDQDAKVMKVTLHVVVGGGWVRDAGTGEPREVAVDDAGTTTDLYRATVLQRQSQTVYLHPDDPSFDTTAGGMSATNLVMGRTLCRADQAKKPRLAYKEDPKWDEWVKGTGFHATRERKNQPSVETLMSLLYRCGAVSREGAVVTMFDRFSAWAEACMVVKLPCIMFVAGAPTSHVQEQVERLCAQGPSKQMSSLIPDLRRGGAEASNHSVGADRAPPARPTARGTAKGKSKARGSNTPSPSGVPEFHRKGELSADQEREVDDYLRLAARGDVHDVLVDLTTAKMRRVDVLRLQPLHWLSDEVVNCYTRLLQLRDDEMCHLDPKRRHSHVFDSFFYCKLVTPLTGRYNHDQVKAWARTKRPASPRDEIGALEYVFVPINHKEKKHWSLVVIHMQEKTLKYYDSLSYTGATELANILEWLEDEEDHRLGDDSNFDREDWTTVEAGDHPTSLPQQNNGDDCAVFMLTFASYIMQDLRFDFGPSDINQFRRRMLWSIMNQRLI